MKTMLCLGAGVEGAPMIEHLQALGYHCIAVDSDEAAPGFKYTGYKLNVSCYHANQIITAYFENGGFPKIDGVLCCAVDAPHVAAEVAWALGVPYNVNARLSNDKLAQKCALKDACIPVPSFALLNDIMRVPAWAGVLKPVDSRGGRGVVRIHAANTADELCRYYIAARNYSDTGRVMVEEWLDGPQISAESIVHNGKVLFTAAMWRNYARLDEFYPLCIEDGSDGPIPEPLTQEISEVVRLACVALGWDNLTVKADMVLHDGKLFVIELAARLSGGYFASHMIPLVYGVDMVGAAAALACGDVPEVKILPSEEWVNVCQRFVFPYPEDIGKTVKRIVYPRELGTNLSYYNLRVGQVIQPVRCHADRWGQVIAASSELKDARHNAEAVVRIIKMGVELE